MTDSYVDQLTLELRRREVPGTRIGEVIAEIEAPSPSRIRCSPSRPPCGSASS